MSRARKKKAEMNSLGVVLSPGDLAGAERSEGERSDPQRSAAIAKAGADSVTHARPDPEVVAKAKRRTYTAEYKQRILAEAETVAATRGALGALLRREGLYSSLLAYWRRERADGILEALTPRKRGPKSKRNPLEEENQKLRRQNALLSEDLRKAHIIIDVPKKVAALLGHRFRRRTLRRNPDDRRHRTSERRRHQRCLPGPAYASRFLLP
jgi:transposase